MALSFGAKDGQWIISLTRQIFAVDTPNILSENRSAIAISSDCETWNNHCHVEQEFHTINELLFLKKVIIGFIGMDKQLANVLTKAFGLQKLWYFLDKACMSAVHHTLASTGGLICASCEEHTPPTTVCPAPGTAD